jgi:chemotaxis protein histidine kinase CheA
MDNPLSLMPAEGNSAEFPVLKAFQEYIDAEQAKARKRMLGLSVFFIVLLSVVVVTFVLILTTVLNRNQSLSDRLLDYALRERDRAPAQVSMPQQAQPSADIVKTLVERLEKEQAEMKAAFEKQKREAEEKAAAIERERTEELKRIQQELATERAKAKKEADKKAEIERHRRRLYPDYYRLESGEDLPLPPPSSSYKTNRSPSMAPETSKEDIKISPLPPNPPQQKKKVNPLSALRPVTYFNLDDDDSVPF